MSQMTIDRKNMPTHATTQMNAQTVVRATYVPRKFLMDIQKMLPLLSLAAKMDPIATATRTTKPTIICAVINTPCAYMKRVVKKPTFIIHELMILSSKALDLFVVLMYRGILIDTYAHH